jgi:hypothetical protein
MNAIAPSSYIVILLVVTMVAAIFKIITLRFAHSVNMCSYDFYRRQLFFPGTGSGDWSFQSQRNVFSVRYEPNFYMQM